MASRQGTPDVVMDTSMDPGKLKRTPSASAQHWRKRQTRAGTATQPENLHRQIALEEYLGALDAPAAILFCGSMEEEGEVTAKGDATPSGSRLSPPARNTNGLTTRPHLTRMTSSGGSWPTSYGSTGSSAGTVDALSHLTSPPTECRVIWGNRYISADVEELLLEELRTENLLQRVWSMGSSRSNKFHTLASKNSADRRITWSVTSIRSGRFLTVIGNEEPQDPSSWQENPAVTEAERPKTAPRWLDVPGDTEETRRHSELFGSVDWASTPLGPPERWCQSLLTMVNLCLSTPSPCLLVWGPELILLYNEPYSKVIGVKHPGILGMRYDLAWPEVWEGLSPVVASAMAGNVIHVSEAQMFLKRGNYLEETYFTWSMIPLRGPNGAVDGIFIPNFDNTARVISERRIRILNILSRAIAEARSPEAIASLALSSFSENIDIPFMAMYLATPAEEEMNQDGCEERSQLTSASSNRRTSIVSDDPCLDFRLAGHVGCIDVQEEDGYVPSIVTSSRSVPPDDNDQSPGLAKYIRMAHCFDDDIVLSAEGNLREVLPNIVPNTFGDLTSYAAIMPIRASAEDRTHGVLVIGLNTRMEFTRSYKDYVNTMRGILATGLASVKLHGEQMARAQYLAALNKRKSDELQVLLKKKTDELRSAELKMSTAFECCPTGIWIANKDFEIVYLNPAYYHITGLRQEAPMDSWIEVVHPGDREMVRETFSRCRQSRIKTEFRILTGHSNPDGTPQVKWVEGTAGPQYDAIGQVCGTIVDITHRKEKEEYQVKRAEDALERKRQQEYFIDMTSHELRNPLSAICLAVEGIVDRLKTITNQDEQSPFLAELQELIRDHDVINLCTQHMRRLIDDVLALSKLDSDMLVVTRVPSIPVAFTQDALAMFEPELKSKSIDYSFSVQEGYRNLVPLSVKIDPQRVTQVLINLLTNAIKFTSQAGIRRITCSLDAARHKPSHLQDIDQDMTEPSSADSLYLIWSVQDTGPGLSKDESSRLFKRFQQAQPRTHVTYGGSGLGLFISKKLTNLLGGDIFLRSNPGSGSIFTFYVQAEPCTTPPSTALPSPKLGSTAHGKEHLAPAKVVSSLLAKPSAHQRKLQVLLTEDNLINQQLLKRQLIKAGCTVFVANNGKEALDFIVEGRSPLDCVLMDVEMPVMGGLECAREIRKRGFDIPVCAVTANARDAQLQQIMECGMNAAVSKPFSTSDLIAQIWALVDTRDAAHL